MTRMMFAVAAAWLMVAAVLARPIGAADAILLEFSSPHCAPCQAMKPILAQIENLGTPVRHIDVASEPYLASRYGISKTPTFIVISGGREVTRLVGTQTLQELVSALEINPSGPLVPTRSTSASPQRVDPRVSAPQTRLAPIGSIAPDALPTAQGEATLVGITPSTQSSEPMPSISVADAVERARAATVRLRVHDGHGYGAGTGTIIDTHGDEALVLTCGHLFRETQGKGKIEVDLYVGGQVRTVLGQVIDYDADTRDVALVAIRPGFPIEPVQVVSPQQQVRNGQTAFSFGCDRGDDPSRRDTRITGVNKYNQHLGVSNLEIAGAPIDGRSGGGLFDETGRIIGVCNAADYQEDVGIYAGPGSIHWQLERVGLTHLYQSVGADSGDAALVQARNNEAAGTASEPPAMTPAAIEQLPGSNNRSPSAEFHLAGNGSAPRFDHSASAQPVAAQEVIVIVRDPRNPGASSQVMTLDRPSTELMQMIRQQARN